MNENFFQIPPHAPWLLECCSGPYGLADGVLNLECRKRNAVLRRALEETVLKVIIDEFEEWNNPPPQSPAGPPTVPPATTRKQNRRGLAAGRGCSAGARHIRIDDERYRVRPHPEIWDVMNEAAREYTIPSLADWSRENHDILVEADWVARVAQWAEEATDFGGAA